MYSFEYYCENCGKKWSNISAYKDLECPYCKESDPQITWEARAYD